MDWSKAKHSINKGLWRTSIGGAETLTSDTALPEEAYPSQLKNQDSRDVVLHFNQGEFTGIDGHHFRSEEHTSELQSRENLVCRLLLEKKKTTNQKNKHKR